MSSNRSTTSMSKRLRLTAGSAGLALAALVLAAGCGSSTKTASGAASAAPTSQPAAPASQPAAPAPATTIAARTTSLGSIVVDSSGRTLYRFDKDMPGSGSSACNAACATTWPPAAVSGQPKAGTGVAGAIGQITRADGSQQVTLDGHPLYRFSGDQASGQTNGDGFGGIWHVVSAGTGAGAATAAATSPSGPSGY